MEIGKVFIRSSWRTILDTTSKQEKIRASKQLIITEENDIPLK